MAVTFTVTDNADNETARRLQRSTDGGTTFTTVDAVGPNSGTGQVTLSDPDPLPYQAVRYRTQIETEHAVANSAPIEVVAIRPGETHAELTSPSGTRTAIGPDEFASISISAEHTAEWRADISIAPATRAIFDSAFADCVIFHDGQQFFDGEVRRPGRDSATGTLRAYGKARELRETTRIVEYPTALGSSSVRTIDAIADYWSRTAATATIQEPTPDPVRTNELFYDLPSPTPFADVVSVADDVPLNVQPTRVDHAPVRFFREAEAGTGGVVVNTTDAPNDHSNAECVRLSNSGNFVEISFTPDHNIPFSEFDPQVRYEFENFDGDIYYVFDNSRIGVNAVGGPASQPPAWRGNVVLSAAGTVDSPPTDPLQAGTTYQFGVEIDNVTQGDVYVDAFAPGDSGTRFGGYNISFDNSVDFTVGAGVLTGPQRFADATSVPIVVSEDFRISESTVNLTISDTSNGQAIRQSITAPVTATNTASQTVDWTAADQYGTTLSVEAVLSRTTTTPTASPTTGDTGQSITGAQVTVSTDTTSVIESTAPLSLDADTDLENAQRLHEAGPFRFVMDHSVAGLNLTSFRTGDSALTRSPSLRVRDDGVSEERDALEYANRVNAVGDGVSLSLISDEEQQRIGASGTPTEVAVGASFPAVTTREELVTRARKELFERIERDERTGRLTIAPEFVEPGFPYTLSAFGNEPANLESVTFEFGVGGSQTTLSFGLRRTLARRVSRQD